MKVTFTAWGLEWVVYGDEKACRIGKNYIMNYGHASHGVHHQLLNGRELARKSLIARHMRRFGYELEAIK